MNNEKSSIDFKRLEFDEKAKREELMKQKVFETKVNEKIFGVFKIPSALIIK